MSDTLFGFLAMLFIYVLGAWSGIFVMALLHSSKDADDFEKDFEKELREHEEDELP